MRQQRSPPQRLCSQTWRDYSRRWLQMGDYGWHWRVLKSDLYIYPICQSLWLLFDTVAVFPPATKIPGPEGKSCSAGVTLPPAEVALPHANGSAAPPLPSLERHFLTVAQTTLLLPRWKCSDPRGKFRLLACCFAKGSNGLYSNDLDSLSVPTLANNSSRDSSSILRI